MMHFMQQSHIGKVTDVPLVVFSTGADSFNFFHGFLPEYSLKDLSRESDLIAKMLSALLNW